MRHLALLVFIVIVGGCISKEISEERLPAGSETIPPNEESSQTQTPYNLSMPFDVEDLRAGEMISPFGVIRKSGDGGIGHGGIDFTLRRSDPVYAVADGEIIYNEKEDDQGGTVVHILLIKGIPVGEGWVFKYEHIELVQGLVVGSQVKKGEKIGESAITFGNNHFGLQYAFNDYTFFKNSICWVSQLESSAKKNLDDKFEEISSDTTFVQLWKNAEAEGYYQYRGLLDEMHYPDGPMLCYDLGTDGRIKK